MRLNPFIFFLSVLAWSLGSCSGENLYEFEELSQKEDYVIELQITPENPNLPIFFSAEFYKTDGFGELLTAQRSFGGFRTKDQPFSYIVKRYKNVGVAFTPAGNIGELRVRIYNYDYGIEVYSETFEVDGEITVFYDFETGEETVNLE